MDSKSKFRLTTLKVLSPEIQDEVDELQEIFAETEEYLEELGISTPITQKSTDLSVEARKVGNELLMEKGHDAKAHRDILRRYSQSIAFAPSGTEEAVLGYGNRAALLMHLQHYGEAMVDIDRALELSKSDDYKKKLQIRRDKCSGLLDEQKMIKSMEHSTLAERRELENMRSKLENFKPSATVSCAADCIGIGYNDVFGRHLVATRDIKPGEIVIIEKGYISSPILTEMHIVCFHCAEIAWNGIPCDECVYATYCSEECKNEAFHEYHDIECPILMYLHQIIFNTENGNHLVTTIRLLIKALKTEGFESVMKEISEKKDEDDLDGLMTDGVFRNDGFKACYNLSTWVKDVGVAHEKLEYQVSQILYLLVNYTNFPSILVKNNSLAEKTSVDLPPPAVNDQDSTSVDPCVLLQLKKAIMRLKSVIDTNGHPLQSGTTQCGRCTDLEDHQKRCNLMRGSAVTPCCSLINHSCTPNLFYVSTPKRKFVVFSSCPVKTGEMLCISYKSIMLFHGNVKTRQEMLKKFVCKCRACMDNIDVNACANERDKDFSIIRAELKKKISASVAKSYFKPSDYFEISEKKYQEMAKISELLYKKFNYYKAFLYSIKCNSYIETAMAKMYQDKISMPYNC